MRRTTQQAESLIGSLCRETVALRQRWHQVLNDLSRCREESLVLRLRGEQEGLRRRRKELQDTVRALRHRQVRDPLALEFLGELTRRPLVE